MAETKNYKPGDRLECDGDILEVVEVTDVVPCGGCYFESTASCPECGVNIHFKLVKQCKTK